ncbi:MAG: hypothetical protein GY851_31230 [bacterium]|nr:hypothetical protein [bacterium]
MGIDMAKYMNPEPFDQDREVERVLEEVRAGKGVPPVLDTSNPNHALWMRATYQDIIDAARAAFHKHRDPVTGAPGRREETITVPGNATGKDELRIVYMSGESTGNLTWGDDEDVVYVTGSTVIHEPQTLRILPGTIILVAAFQDDQKDGAMTEEMVGAIHALYSSDPAGQELSDLFGQDMAFRKRHCEPAVVGVLLARGTEAGPILLVGDEGTPYDFRNWHFWNGIVDYVVSENSTLFDSESRNTLTARSKFDNHWGSGRNGAGWVVANYFGDCWYECVDIHSGKLDVLYNIFNSRTAAGGVTLADSPGSVVVEFNTFRANHVSVIETYSGIGSSAISRNNFLPQDLVPSNPYVFVQRSQHPIDATGNYWGRSTEARDSAIFDGNDEPRFARLGIHPCLSHPVPMPFKTGIPEIDNVRD